MNKKPILSKHPKKLIVFLLVCLITITLAGCDSSNKKPTDDIPLNEVYASAGENEKYKVSVEEVFNKLRYNAVEYLENRVYNFLYQDEIKTLTDDLYKEDETVNPDSIYMERLENEIKEDIYGVSEQEDIDALTDKVRNNAVLTYVDEMYKKGYKISADDVRNGEFETVYSYYYLEVAKYIAAKNKLEGEFTKDGDKINFGEINDESYFTKDEVVSYYENNYKNTGDITGILVRFINEKEAKDVLKKFGLKSLSGKWYQIKLSETDKRWETKNGWDKYYDEYKIDFSSDDTQVESIGDYGNGLATVLKVYAAIYNYVYAPTNEKGEYVYRNPIVLDNTVVDDNDGHLKYYRYIEEILNNDRDYRIDKEENKEKNDMYETLLKKLENDYKENAVMDKERLDKYSSSLRSYIYTTLKTEEQVKDEKAYTQYLTDAKSYNGYYFLVFKGQQDAIADELDEEGNDNPLYEEIKTEDDKDDIKFNENNKEFLNKILMEMFDDELSDTYINNAFDERVKEAKIEIYDSLIEIQFMNNSTSLLAKSYKKTKKQNNKAIAEVTYKDKTPLTIYAKDAYSYLEPIYGPQIASNLLFQQFIKDSDYYKVDLAGKDEEYIETLKLLLYYFSNDYYASSGYPASIGKYNFMTLYFGTADVDAAVEYLKISDATSAFFADFTSHGFASGDKFYEELRDYALGTYNKFYSLTASGLTVYVDKDEDGVADELGEEDSNPLYVAAKELLEVALEEVQNSNTDYTSAFNNIVSEFNSSSRIDDDNPTTPESKWAKYRKLGLHIKVSSYGTITNTTDGVDKNIVNRVTSLYKTVVDPVLGFTSNYLDNEIFATKDNEVTTLLITGGALPTSAAFEDEDLLKLYENINVIRNNKKETIEELDYTKKEINLKQVIVYVSEYVMFGDVYSLPSTTTAALDAYLLPVISKYTGAASQQKLVAKEIGKITFKYSGELSDEFNPAFKAEYKENGRAGFFAEYNTILQNTDDNYDLQYESWWTKMYN